MADVMINPQNFNGTLPQEIGKLDIKIKKIHLMFLILSLSLWGCGYRFSGGGTLPAGIKTVSISTFTNKTSMVGIENIITSDIIYEFTRSNEVTLSSPQSADASVSGTVNLMRIDTVARRGSNRSLERKVTVYVALILKDRNGKIIRNIKEISDNEIFEVTLDKIKTELNRKRAIKKLSPRLAEKIFNSLAEDF